MLQGNIENVEFSEKFILIEGWVAGVDGDAACVPLRLALNEQGNTEISTFVRADLKDVGIASGDAAFSVAVARPSCGKLREITIIDGRGRVAKLDVTTLGEKNFAPRGAIEQIGPEGITGWIFDPRIDWGDISATIDIDGEIAVPIKLNQIRDDLPYQINGNREPLLGFRADATSLIDSVRSRRGPNALNPIQLHLRSGATNVCTEHVVVSKANAHAQGQNSATPGGPAEPARGGNAASILAAFKGVTTSKLRTHGIPASVPLKANSKAIQARQGNPPSSTDTRGNQPPQAPPKWESFDAIHEEYDRNLRRHEFDALIAYAKMCRSAELPETFVGLVSYLLTQSSRMRSEHIDDMAVLLAQAIRITQDAKLIELAADCNPALVHEVKIPAKLLRQFVNIEQNWMDQDDVESIQHDPDAILRYLRRDKKRYRQIMNNPRVGHLLAANMCRASSPILYRSHLNKAIAASGARIAAIDTASPNVLESVRWEPLARVEGGPKVSVIMSAFNAAETIGYAMKSVLQQTYQRLELLVCDDNSSDGTLDLAVALANTDARIKVFRSRHNQGTYNIRNNLLKVATGEIIAFQDSDDVAIPTRIQQQVAAFDSPEIQAAFGHWVRIQPNGQVVFFHDGSAVKFCVVSLAARRSVFSLLPPFRSSLVAADTEFYGQLKAKLGASAIRILEHPVLLGLWGAGSLTQGKGVEANSSGYVAPSRRRYIEIASRQRILGGNVILNGDVTLTLQDNALLRKDAGVDFVK